MKNVLYITTFNDPGSCENLMDQLTPLIPHGYEPTISDQSTPEYATLYQALAQRSGWKYVHHDNGGAQKAKHDIIRHASAMSYSFMAQISEDFELVTTETAHPAIPIGTQYFMGVADDILKAYSNISFVNWTFFRPSFIGWATGYHLDRNPLHRLSEAQAASRLMWISGDIALFNWPYTGRVSALKEMLDQASINAQNSEVTMMRVSMGHGVCLLAQPVRHTDRPRPTGSIR
jgi:hypothetical protein